MKKKKDCEEKKYYGKTHIQAINEKSIMLFGGTEIKQ